MISLALVLQALAPVAGVAQEPAHAAQARSAKPVAKKPPAKPAPDAQAPCARGRWKDDPVCFGEGDSDVLPTPSADSAGKDANDVKTGGGVKPKLNLNSRLGSGVIYKRDGTAVTSDFGGALGLQLPF